MAAEDVLPGDAHRDREAVRQRRAALKNADGTPQLAPDAPIIGLALSGGGIRSATFCLGLLRALAKNGVLHRFDYLSTVSGGGYIGAMLGRLFHRGSSGAAKHVEAGMADDRSLLLWWLRNNGRFLLPSGGKDILQAFAGQFRGFLATQFEVMVVAMFLTCLVVLPHVLYSWRLGPSAVPLLSFTLWWWGLPVAGILALITIDAYWILGLAPRIGFGISLLAIAVGGYLAYLGFASPMTLSASLLWVVRVAALAILSVVPGWVCAVVSNRRREQESNRILYTKRLAYCFLLAGMCLVLGCLDMGGWMLRDIFLAVLNGESQLALPWGIGWTSLLLIVARAIAPLLTSKERVAATGLPLETLGNLLGLILILLVAVFWLGVFQMILLPSVEGSYMGVPAAYFYLPAVVVVGALFLCFTGNEVQQLNRSSLHYFYRSRLARSYVAVGNYGAASGATTARFPVCPLQTDSPALVEGTQRVSDLLPGDDVLLGEYRPHAAGGPVHLINCCINQTTDDRTGLFNADRKGVSLTVGPLGVETGTQLPSTSHQAVLEQTTLAEWVAISGAAVGSGMGSLTKPGVAVMTFLSGFRLGYWRRSLTRSAEASRVGLAKYASLLREMFAHFPGLNAPYWYLSDGGHFDNTGVYALLKRRLPLIVLADCGADPDYLFRDVENLVRKARIDHDALIEFVDADSLTPFVGPLAARFGTPTSIAPGEGEGCLMLARITYAKGQQGALLVVKPRVVPDLELDISGYASRNQDFPQQSTLNQFFSEEEWEAYCALGLMLGRWVDASVLDSATQWAWQGQVAPTPAAGLSSPTPAAAKAPRRVAATVGKSLGAGALITSLLAGWQAWSDYQKQKQTQDSAFETVVDEAFKELSSATTGFTPEFKFQLNTLHSRAVRYQLSSDQQATMQEIGEQIQALCADKNTDASLKGDCMDIAAKWGNGDVSARSYWSVPLARYTNWPTRSSTEASQPASTLAELSLPSIVPPPPPPPPPMVEPPMAMASTPAAARAPVLVEAESMVSPAGGAARSRNEMATAAKSTDLASASTQVSQQCARSDGRLFTLYTQIYDEQQRASALQLLSNIRPFGIVVPDVENVTATAKRNQRKPPIPWSKPTLLYGTDGQQCAQALSAWMHGHLGDVQALPLPSSMATGNHVIELWLPPPTNSP